MSDEWRLVLTTWTWYPSVVMGVAVLLGGYLAAIGPLRLRFSAAEPPRRRQTICYVAGVLTILFALVSPLDALGDEYWWSAHMLQHVLLTFVAAPLLLLGTPDWLLRPLWSQPGLWRVARRLTAPLLAATLFNANLIIWHVPALYELTLHHENLHILAHTLFLTTAILLWWPLLSPTDALPRSSYPIQLGYLVFNTIPMTAVGALITFATSPLIPLYAGAPRLFAVSVMTDQVAAGLIMWILEDMIYLVALTFVFFRWVAQEERSG